MPEESYIPLESPSEWNRALKGIPHSFAHTWASNHAMHLTTGLDTYLYRSESPDGQIVSPVSERVFDGHIDVVKPFGISGFVGAGRTEELAVSWSKFARERRYVCGYLGFHPVFDISPHFPSEEVFEYDAVHVMDLAKPLDEILLRMSPSRRRDVKRFEEHAHRIVVDRRILSDFFLANFDSFMQSKGASQIYSFSRDTLQFLLGCENVDVVGIEEAGEIVAANVFVHTEYIADGLFNISLPQGRRYATHLYWHAMTTMRKLGVPLFNLGGGGGGVAEFKRHFGAVALPLKCLKQVYSEEVYKSLCENVGAASDDRNGYFPAFRRPVVATTAVT